ncbi:AGAMOUS-like 64 [Euphorbia peplus]|nr:AGAMOUS-like 64 [Euphorbia peplus]
MAGEGRKKTRGRQRIELKMIKKLDDKLITFPKRRFGVYKKASELDTLTGSQIGFMVYSPAGEPFTFAHPSMEAIVNRFLGRQGGLNDNIHSTVEANQLADIEELAKQHNVLLEKDKENMRKQKMVGVEKGLRKILMLTLLLRFNLKLQLIYKLRFRIIWQSTLYIQPVLVGP